MIKIFNNENAKRHTSTALFLQTVFKVLLLCCPEARHIYPQWNRCGSPEIDPFYYRANRFSTVVPDQGGGSSPDTWHIEWEGHLYTFTHKFLFSILYVNLFTENPRNFHVMSNSFLHISQKGQQQ